MSAARAREPAPTADDSEDTGEWKTPRTEANVLPAVGGDTDIGIGGGGLFDVARVKPYVEPYAWRIEGSGFIAFKLRDEALRVTFQDYYFQWTAPHALTDRLRLEVRPSFTMEPTQKYFGLGNAAPDVREGHDYNNDTRYFEYSRTRATLQVTARVRLSGPLHAQVSPSYTQNWLEAREDSALTTDMRTGGSKVRELLGDTRPHGVARFEYGMVWDTRNDEVSTTKGGFHHVKLRLSPGGSGEVPYRFGQVNVTARFYVTPVRGVTLAVRLVGDLLFGSPPFYELARYEDTFAFGGANGVRGIPAQRYYGKIKAFGNFEARFRVAEFSLLGKASKFGLVTFADGGRLWTDYQGTADLDGPLLNVKYGLGGGFRLQQGETFLLRADVAWSPDARPIGVYFDASQAF